MKIKLISFSESKLVSMNVAHEVIVNKIRQATSIKEEFLFCATQKEMFLGVKEGIEKADVIVLAVDISKFISTKAALFRAMGFKCRLNSKINELINSDACMATLNENQINAHAAIPVGGEAFVSADGLFSGFGIKSGKQKLIFIPIDEKRIETVIENGMITFITEGYSKEDFEKCEEEKEAEAAEEITEVIREEVVTSAEEIAEAETAEEAKEENTESDYVDVYSSSFENKEAAEVAEEKADDQYEDISSSSLPEDSEESVAPQKEEKEESNMDKIASRSIKIAFVRQTENAVYTNVLAEVSYSDAADFVDFPLEKDLTEDIRRKENVASNARKALKQTDAAYAVAMSEIFYDENGTGYIYATLADLQKSSVYKIFAADDETDKDLYRTGLESLLEKIEESTRSVNARSVAIAQQSEEAAEQKRKIPSSTLIVIWILIIIAVGTLTALVLDMVLSKDASVMSSTSAIVENLNDIRLLLP